MGMVPALVIVTVSEPVSPGLMFVAVNTEAAFFEFVMSSRPAVTELPAFDDCAVHAAKLPLSIPAVATPSARMITTATAVRIFGKAPSLDPLLSPRPPACAP